MKILKVWVCQGCEPNCRISAEFVGPEGPQACPGTALAHLRCKEKPCIECERGHKRKFVLEEIQSQTD